MDYSKTRASMMRVARAFVRTAEEAEDVVQETWLAVLKGVHRFQGRSSLNTWLFRILVNRARSRARREARSVPLSQSGIDVDALRSSGADPAQALLAKEVQSQVRAAIAALPRQQQTVIALRDLEGYSADEVCEVLRLSAANQRVLLHRARSAVKAQLLPYFAQ